MRSQLSEANLQWLIDTAGKLGKLYDSTGFISIDRWSTHLTEDEFKLHFNEYTQKEFNDTSDKASVIIQNHEFYCLVEADNAPEPKPKPEVNLPVVQLELDKQRVDILTMLIDYYRLKESPNRDLDSFLNVIKHEIQSTVQHKQI